MAPVLQAAEVTLTAERIEGPGFVARNARAHLDPRDGGRLDMAAASVEVEDRTWRNLTLACRPILIRATRVGCEKGVFDIGEKIPFRLAYDMDSSALDVELLPAAGESWHATWQPAGMGWKGRIDVEAGSLLHLAPLLPAAVPKLNGGRVSGGFDIVTAPTGEVSADGGFSFSSVAFSDATGLHAAEKLGGVVRLVITARSGTVRYRAAFDWNEGELFWQPLYLKGGHFLHAEGTLDEGRIAIDSGRARIKRVGEVAFSGSWDRRTGALVTSAGGGAALDIAGVYEEVAKPFLAHTATADMRTEGKADFGWRFEGGALQAWYLNLHRASFEDRNRRFGIFDLNAAIPWDRASATRAQVTLEGAELLRLPVGRVDVPIELEGFVARIPQLEVPLLDGTLRVTDFVARRPGEAWEWEFAGGVTPLSVEALTRTLGVQVMHGTLSAVVPKVEYRESKVRVDGALLFQVFDGTVVINQLSLLDPLGRVPRLHADVDMRGLDLDLVTRAFSFGSITGRIDAQVNGLELANWLPVKFDARVESSPGNYRKRISQRAVENITALGGSSASAAIQRTALRFFDEFGYSRIGWSCKLRNGVCEMGGVGPGTGGYVIVEGGGVPAITVMGYNRAVDWEELIARLARVTKNGSAPVIE
ncbi:MAG: hypothetical protein ABWY12_17355 [Burkholderiales bacterium]